jgi:hypothetical protein
MNLQDADIFWLITANVALGLVTFVPVVAVLGSVLVELLDRWLSAHP